MTSKRWTRWVIPAALAATVIALNVAGFTVRSVQEARGRVPGLTVIRPPQDVSAVTIWSDTVYVGGQAGLFAVDLEKSQARAETFGGSLEPAHVRALLAQDDTLWIGRDTGLVRVDASGAHVLGVAEGLPSERIRCLMRDSDGRVWVGTADGAAIIENGAVTRVLTTEDGLVDDVVNAIAQDAEGRIWLGSYESPEGGVSVVASDLAGVVAWFTSAEGLPHPSVTCILPEADGTVWVGTGFHDRGGLARFAAPASDTISLAQTYQHSDGLAGPKVRSLFRSPTGVLWVGSERDGIALWPAGQIDGADSALVTSQTGISDNEVKSILLLPDDRLLLATRNGITILEDVGVLENTVLGGGN